MKAGQDLTNPRRLVIVALILVFGIGGLCLSAGEFAIEGIGLAGITGVVLNLVLPRRNDHGQHPEINQTQASQQE